MNAIVTQTHFADTTPSGHHTVFSPRRQADFLASLALNGNVRLACRAASVSAQTAYRARRASPAFARAWDAACLAARDHAEQVLADRAINGVEEAVFYHGEEVARRRRYSDRLLLAHLARLDRMAERADVAATIRLLDDQIEALRRGEDLPEAAPDILPQDRVPGVPDSWDELRDSNNPDSPFHPHGSWEHRVPPAAYPAWEADMDDPDHWRHGEYAPPLARRYYAMDDARPRDAAEPHQIGSGGVVAALQLTAFEAGLDEWWMIADEEALEAAFAALDAAERDGEAGEGPDGCGREGPARVPAVHCL